MQTNKGFLERLCTENDGICPVNGVARHACAHWHIAIPKCTLLLR